MPCSQCVGIDQMFDEQSAIKQLKKYLKKGPEKPTALLIAGLEKQSVKGLSLLDIGGGIGAIHHAAIESGVSSVTDVDASAGYLKVAKEEAARRNVAGNIKYLQGDFLDVAEEVASHDIVTLDKVICCYPDVEQLLSKSLKRTNQFYALVFPKSVWVGRVASWFVNLGMAISGSSFRTYIHSRKLVEQRISEAGFQKCYHRKTFVWHVQVWKKVSD